LLPQNLVEVFLSQAKVSGELKCNNVTIQQRKNIIKALKCFTLSFKSLYNLNVGVVTSGGVDLKEINPKTMESKKHKNLFFIGEVLDVDAFTGGFNLQIAFSTAYACAKTFDFSNE
jgi:predicted flavoprotein YhiN